MSRHVCPACHAEVQIDAGEDEAPGPESFAGLQSLTRPWVEHNFGPTVPPPAPAPNPWEAGSDNHLIHELTVENLLMKHQLQVLQNVLGMVEEVGELAHALLKQAQGIRGPWDTLEAKAKDALGDVFVFAANVANRKGWDLARVVRDVWEVVRDRDWRKNPGTGQGAG
jgi:NTP pyrophosphatase (non-canonical NTP hydrolase)